MSETPGPGTYRVPSDFGYLELKKFVNTELPSGRNHRNTNQTMQNYRANSIDVGSDNPMMIGAPYAQSNISRFMNKRKSQ